MHYKVTEYAALLGISVEDVKQAIKYRWLNVQFNDELNTHVISYDEASIQFQKLATSTRYIENGVFKIPIFKNTQSKRIRIINRISILERIYKRTKVFVARHPDSTQILFQDLKSAVLYTQNNTQYVKRSVSSKKSGHRVIPFTEDELQALLRNLPRNTMTKRLITKLTKHLHQLRLKNTSELL